MWKPGGRDWLNSAYMAEVNLPSSSHQAPTSIYILVVLSFMYLFSLSKDLIILCSFFSSLHVPHSTAHLHALHDSELSV